MDRFLGLTVTAWTAIYTLLTAGLLATAVSAAWYAYNQWKDGQVHAEEVRRAEAERDRPYVIVTTESSGAGLEFFDLVIRNIGPRPAFNIRVSLDPRPQRADEMEGNELHRAKMLTEPIAMLAPGQDMRSFYDSHVDRSKRDDLPTSHSVTVQYTDSGGTVYNEVSTLDVAAGEGTVYVTVYTMHNLVQSVQRIEKQLRSASVLASKGSLDVDSACESRNAKHTRLASEAAEAKRLHRQIIDDLAKARTRSVPPSTDASTSDPDE